MAVEEEAEEAEEVPLALADTTLEGLFIPLGRGVLVAFLSVPVVGSGLLVGALPDVGALEAEGVALVEAEGAWVVASDLADEGLMVAWDALPGEIVANEAPALVRDGASVLEAGADVLIEFDGALVVAGGVTVGGDVPLTGADSTLDVGLFNDADGPLLIEAPFAAVVFGVSLLETGLEVGATIVPRLLGTPEVGVTDVVVPEPSFPAGIANIGAAAAAAIRRIDEVFILKGKCRRVPLGWFAI